MYAFSPSTAASATTRPDISTIANGLCERASARNRARLASIALAKDNWEKELAQLRSVKSTSSVNYAGTNVKEQNDFWEKRVSNIENVTNLDIPTHIIEAYNQRMKLHGIVSPIPTTNNNVSKTTTSTRIKKEKHFQEALPYVKIEERKAITQAETSDLLLPSAVKAAEEKMQAEAVMMTKEAQNQNVNTKEEGESVERPNLIRFLTKLFNNFNQPQSSEKRKDSAISQPDITQPQPQS